MTLYRNKVFEYQLKSLFKITMQHNYRALSLVTSIVRNDAEPQ